MTIRLHLNVNNERERLIAETVYRDAWFTFCFARCDGWRGTMAMLMDESQLSIATGPNDPRWQRFIENLPAFLPMWTKFYEERHEDIERMFGGEKDEDKGN